MKIIIKIALLVLVFSCNDNNNEKIKKEIKKVSTKTKFITNTSNDEMIEKFYDAIIADDQVLINKMLEKEFPANFEPKTKMPALELAIWENRYEIAKTLIEKGARTRNGDFSSLLVASEYGRLDILKYLIEVRHEKIDETAFSVASFSGKYDCAKYLLLKGANQDKGDIRGKLSFLIETIKNNDLESLKALKFNEGEIDYHDCEGKTPLIIAVENNSLEILDYLIKNGADINKPETFDCGDDISIGLKPLEIAKKKGNKEIIDRLNES
jgi:uncharacterized protein